jgi:hypothetical protein
MDHPGPLDPVRQARRVMAWLAAIALVAAFIGLCYLIRMAFAPFGAGPMFGA